MALRLDGAGPRGAEGLRKAWCVLPDPRLVAGRAGALPRVRAVRLVDLRTLNRHPGAAISNLISSVSCRRRICARSGCAGSM